MTVLRLPVQQVHSIRDEIQTTGNNPLLVISEENYKLYYLKSPGQLFPPFPLIKEIICHYLIKLWDLMTPNICLMRIDEETFHNYHGALTRYNNIRYFRLPGFASESWDFARDESFITDHVSTKHDYNKFNKPLDFLKICLFDIWIENDDRKPTNFNLLLDDNYDFVAIDHAFTFCTQAFQSLDPEFGVVQSYNDNLLYSRMGRKILKFARHDYNLSEVLKKYFYFCIKKCEDNWELITPNIPVEYGLTEQDLSFLHSFLFSRERNLIVFRTFIERLA